MNDKQKTVIKYYSDTCVCCGAPVPEGRMVCFDCESENKLRDSFDLPLKKKQKKD